MKKLITLVLGLMLTLSVHATNFSENQVHVLKKSYDYGKNYDSKIKEVEWILPAIAWQESGAGRAKVNKNKTAFGEFHNLARVVYSREKQRNIEPSLPNFESFSSDNPIDILEAYYYANRHIKKAVRTDRENIKYISYRLSHDFDYAAYNAIQELEDWYKYHKGNTDKMLASYFAGFGYNKSVATKYVNSVKKKIRYLKKSGILDETDTYNIDSVSN